MMNISHKIDIIENEVDCLLYEHWYDNHNSELMSILYDNSSIFKFMNHNKCISEYISYEYKEN